MKGKGILAITGLLMIAMIFTIATPVQAVTDLKVTANNLNTLNSFTNSGAWYNVGADSYLLKWYGGGEYFEPPWKAPAVYRGIITATIMADYQGSKNSWGECVSMIKNLAHSTVATGSWSRGKRITDGGVSSGTTLATFVWSSAKGRYVYSGHAAIFREYTYDSYGKINGIMIWDQNWYKNEKGEGIVAMHKITKASADAYYVIQV
jgi:hypothetical protein